MDSIRELCLMASTKLEELKKLVSTKTDQELQEEAILLNQIPCK